MIQLSHQIKIQHQSSSFCQLCGFPIPPNSFACWSHVGIRNNIYRLLTKREVKMAGYWLSSFFVCLRTKTKLFAKLINSVPAYQNSINRKKIGTGLNVFWLPKIPLKSLAVLMRDNVHLWLKGLIKQQPKKSCKESWSFQHTLYFQNHGSFNWNYVM